MSNLQPLNEVIPDLKPFLHTAWDKSAFKKLTTIQLYTTRLILEGKDIIAESPTGSGKTLAYLLPLLQQIKPDQKNTQVVILASSHELVMQIHQHVQDWSKQSEIGSATLIGGANVKRQIEKLKKKPQLVIGTPGRINELISQKKLKMHQVKTIVLDEADQLLVSEHLAIIEGIVKSTMKDRQVLVFSATLPDPVQKTAARIMNSPEVIQVGNEEDDRPNVTYLYLVCEARDKIDWLRKLIRNQEMKALVFVKDITTLSVLAEKLDYMGIRAGVLHSDANKQERAKAMKAFRDGESELLLASDVAARGLDIPNLSHVIHMDLPNEKTQFVHRSGRTGRLGAESGTVIAIVTEIEERQLQKFSRQLGLTVVKGTIRKGQFINNEER
ncbi:Superfamily II DNA and RNA helicase [Amphibacillus marinus]|uniref:Superfamily II DNA and RNA helicase n=1 Tax=Amphibacillus marinus TaxID=872970 RepID=A0A1H8ISN2_9BACI|nr:DEAD/DEAH box helicase [Amphibacillus marinus]SEN71663.1 Superfamily II DNA and RNA helicase [Amphibacillus marinus]